MKLRPDSFTLALIQFRIQRHNSHNFNASESRSTENSACDAPSSPHVAGVKVTANANGYTNQNIITYRLRQLSETVCGHTPVN
jgi:hypothetical protein